ncbi:MAG: DUF1614 domain-containing protein [Desulfobaccales bacterium]
MFYSPLIFLVMVVFFLIALVLLPFLWLGVIGNAFVNLQETILAVNVGGAIIPAALSVYLFVQIFKRMGVSWGLLANLGAVTAVMYLVARPVKGLGIAVPGLVPPLVAALGAWILCPGKFRAPCAFIASTMGTLIGADLLHLREIAGLGAPVASIGGAGTFDAIFLSGIIAVLLSY